MGGIFLADSPYAPVRVSKTPTSPGVSADIATAREQHAAITLPSGHVLVFGGIRVDGRPC
jgi:hypothetical protein